MPHTSHKKKPSRHKRSQVTDEDGWTHISSTHPTPKTQYELISQDITDTSWKLTWCSPSPVEDGMTEEKLMQAYKAVEEKWKASPASRELAKSLHEKISNLDIKVKACVCFGSGSMSGAIEGLRHETAMIQIAAFMTALSTIGEAQSSRPAAYAQEPRYNTLDATFLEKLQIAKVDSPGGWDIMDESSFAYCPGAEHIVAKHTLSKNPAFYLGQPSSYLEVHNIEAVRADGSAEDREIVQRFLSTHAMHRLPDFEAPNFPFYHVMLYSRTPDDQD